MALASPSSTPMVATLCRQYLPRLASSLTVIAGSHLYRSRRSSGCVQRAISELALQDGALARSSGFRGGAAETSVLCPGSGYCLRKA